MNGAYTATVRQLLDIAPVVFTTPHFALKGGTALNLFLHDLPRLSVDIDVVFTNHSLGREAALQAIAAELSAISQTLPKWDWVTTAVNSERAATSGRPLIAAACSHR
jgi:hypothetical protein